MVAVDIDTTLLAGVDHENLEVRELDIVSDEVEGQFDLVHTRSVLMHIPAREQVIDKLVGHLKPGGWLVLEEGDYFPIWALANGGYLEISRQTADALANLGAATDWARRLPLLLQQRGLQQVQSECDVPFFPGRSPMAEFYRLTWAQLCEAGVVPDKAANGMDQGADDLEDPTKWFPAVAAIAAWGRSPYSGHD